MSVVVRGACVVVLFLERHTTHTQIKITAITKITKPRIDPTIIPARAPPATEEEDTFTMSKLHNNNTNICIRGPS